MLFADGEADDSDYDDPLSNSEELFCDRCDGPMIAENDRLCSDCRRQRDAKKLFMSVPGATYVTRPWGVNGETLTMRTLGADVPDLLK